MSALRASILARSTGAALVDAYLRRRGSALRPTDAYDLAAFCGWIATHQPGASVDMAVAAFTAADLDAFLTHELRGRRGRRCDPSTVYRRLVALGRFYQWAAEIGAVTASPVPPERSAGRPRDAAARPTG